MANFERNANIAAVVIPFLGVIAAAVLLWNRFLGPRDLAIFAVMYLLSALGVTVGFHRLLTHRAFRRARGCATRSRCSGSMSLQGGVIDWVADHRKHHTFTDEEGDPHSPHAGHGAGLRGMVAGLWHAHVGWLFETHGQASSKRFAPTSCEDRTMRRINKSFPLIALLQPLLPFLLGFALSGGSLVAGGLSALLWAGSCGSSSCTTSPGASTRSATSSAAAGSTPTTSRRTSSGSRCRRWARPGTTTTTPSPSPRSTACAGTSSTPIQGRRGAQTLREGELDEEMVHEARPGEAFLLGLPQAPLVIGCASFSGGCTWRVGSVVPVPRRLSPAYTGACGERRVALRLGLRVVRGRVGGGGLRNCHHRPKEHSRCTETTSQSRSSRNAGHAGHG
jgi:hypothetical protein